MEIVDYLSPSWTMGCIDIFFRSNVYIVGDYVHHDVTVCTVVLSESDIMINYSKFVLEWDILDSKLFYRVRFVLHNYSKIFYLFCFIVSKFITEIIWFTIYCIINTCSLPSSNFK